jgi:hypothetical protein
LVEQTVARRGRAAEQLERVQAEHAPARTPSGPRPPSEKHKAVPAMPPPKSLINAPAVAPASPPVPKSAAPPAPKAPAPPAPKPSSGATP